MHKLLSTWTAVLLMLGTAETLNPARSEQSVEPENQKTVTAENSNFLDADGKLDIEAAVDYFEDLYRSESSISEAELRIIRPRRGRALKMKAWTQGDDKALVEIQSPPREKGTATLRVDENLWNYLPRIRRTIRIPPSMMLASWMGSDFTNDDLVRESSYSEDYTYRLKGRSENPEGWIIEFTAKEGTVGLWKSFELIVSRDGKLPVCSKWYNRRGELARGMTWTDVKIMDGRRIPAKMTLVPRDKDKEGHKTVMIYHSIDFGADLPANTFSLSRLEQKR